MNWHDDKILIMLSFFLIMFSGMTLIAAFKLPDDGQTFTLFSSATSALIGALVGWVKPPNGNKPNGSI